MAVVAITVVPTAPLGILQPREGEAVGAGQAGSAQQSGVIAVGPAGELLIDSAQAAAEEPWSNWHPQAGSAEGLEAIRANQSLQVGNPDPTGRNVPIYHEESGRNGQRTQGS